MVSFSGLKLVQVGIRCADEPPPSTSGSAALQVPDIDRIADWRRRPAGSLAGPGLIGRVSLQHSRVSSCGVDVAHHIEC